MPNYPDPNPGKQIEIEASGEKWSRWPIRTPVINADTNITDLLKDAVLSLLSKDDLVIVAESVVAIAEGRAYKFNDIKASKPAKFLSRFVHKSPYGIGLGTPQTMELAIRECGILRIVLAATASGIGKLVRIRGLFYRLAGPQARLIDGPCSNTLPPYNEFATLGPKNPMRTAHDISRKINAAVAIVDANDLGVNCIGAYPQKFKGWKTRKLAEALCRDNPGGQSREQTPVILGRILS